MTVGRFGTAINCIDGRVQEPVAVWLKERYEIDYVDVITEAGPDKALATEAKGLIESIRKKVEISVTKHGSEVIAVVGHHDCVGNPVSKETHWEHIEKAAVVIRSWGYRVSVHGLWVDEDWRVQVVTE